MNTIRRTYKSAKETEKDYYQTNPYMVLALKEWMLENGFNPNSKILDPCCGEGVIANTLNKYFYDVTFYDKFHKIPEYRRDFLNEVNHPDIIVMNPPYSNKYTFIELAMGLADYVFCLLPLNVSNYNMFHRDFEDIPEFVGKIQMTPKMFLDQTTDFKPGGTAAYTWYVWSNKENSSYSKTWYKDLIKIKERYNDK